jgi:hypothetical protein
MNKSYHNPSAITRMNKNNRRNIFKQEYTNTNTNMNTNTNNTNSINILSNYDSDFPSLINPLNNNSNNIKPKLTNNWVKIVENNTTKNKLDTIKETNFSIENYKNYVKKDVIDDSDIDEQEEDRYNEYDEYDDYCDDYSD